MKLEIDGRAPLEPSSHAEHLGGLEAEHAVGDPGIGADAARS
jgi:hypothetical protein